jgi:hypothetical protein
MSKPKAAKPFMFVGACAYCGRDAKVSRGGVEIAVAGDAWVCLRCACTIATSIYVAVSECRRRIFTGHEFKFGKWRKKLKKTKRSAS